MREIIPAAFFSSENIRDLNRAIYENTAVHYKGVLCRPSFEELSQCYIFSDASLSKKLHKRDLEKYL